MPGQISRLTGYMRNQATPRSLAGLSILVAMLTLVGIGNLIESVANKQTEVADLQRSVAVQRSLSDGQEWVDAVSALRAQLDDVEGRFWRGATSGIVAAQLQNEIEDAARRAGLDRIRIEVQPLTEPLGASARERFEILVTARDRNGQFLNFFQQLQGLDYLVVPTDFEWQRPNSSVRATLLAPAIIGSSSSERVGNR